MARRSAFHSHCHVPRSTAAAPCVELRAAQKSELATVIEVLLREIAAALAKAASEESGDDQDHD
jgi:hypothetical protein